MRKRANHGGAIIEFALIAPFLTSLIIGTMMYGTQLVKELELQQIARDTGSMAARGTNFNNTANQAIVSRLGQELGWPNNGLLTSTSPGVVYVSTIKYLDAMCNTGGTPCANHDNWVFVRSVAFGNTGMRRSNFGAPPACVPGCYDSTQNDGSINPNDILTNTGDVVQNFTYLGTPNSNNTGFQPGQPAFLVEVAGNTGPWNGGVATYAFSLF